ncbi:MAG: ShlB/FhaC/HecB family hemolysin secretion/activation protein [Burkholderiales bacterium]|nr:ShlB/FhaC/HecB family hemolysin secretion/activation protein [Burkholderiales bacterium]
MQLPIARLAPLFHRFSFTLAVAAASTSYGQTLAKLPADEQPCFALTQIILDSGADPLPKGLQEALSLGPDNNADNPMGQCIGAQGVQLLIDRVQNALISQGFVTSRVLAAPQNLQTGTLTLNVFMGKLADIQWADPPSGQFRRARAWNAVPAQKGDFLNMRDVEQALENFKRVPTAEADIQIVAADEEGHSNLLINHSQPRFLRLNLTLDDSGTPSVGKQQASATLSYDNWLTLSDLFYITVTQDTGVAKEPGSRGTHGKTWHYSIPFGYQWLTINHSQSSYYQTVAGLNQDYVYAGTSETSDLKVSRVVQRDAAGKTIAGLKAFKKQSNNYIDDTEVEVQKRVVGGWVWDIAHKRSLGQASLDTTLSYKKGTGNFGSIAAPEEATNEGTSRMRIWNADTYLSLPLTLAEKAFTYSLNWRYQLNQTRLT